MFSHALTNPRFFRTVKTFLPPSLTRYSLSLSWGLEGWTLLTACIEKKNALSFRKPRSAGGWPETIQDSKVNTEQAVCCAGGVGHALCSGFMNIDFIVSMALQGSAVLGRYSTGQENGFFRSTGALSLYQ